MPYFTITDFAAGMDLRRSALTAPAGTLRVLRNAHISPGGEIEKRFAFVQTQTLPANSRGLVSVNQKLYTFVPMTTAQIDAVNPYQLRKDAAAYTVGMKPIMVRSNRSRIFTITTAGTSAKTEPTGTSDSIWNKNDKSDEVTLAVGDITAQSGSSGLGKGVRSANVQVAGKKFYFEMEWNEPGGTYTCCGLTLSPPHPLSFSATGADGVYVFQSGHIVMNATELGVHLGAVGAGKTVFCWAVDLSTPAHKLWVGKYAPDVTATVTISVASPAVVADTAHGLVVNSGVRFASDGTLPIGIVKDVQYFVHTVIDANSYTVSATLGGAEVVTTGPAPTGTITRSSIGIRWNASTTADPAQGTGGIDITAVGNELFAGAGFDGTKAIITFRAGATFTGVVPEGFSHWKDTATATRGYDNAVDGTVINDGTMVVTTSTPATTAGLIDDPIAPTIIEPTGPFDVGQMPLETTTLFEIIDLDLFDNKVFVVAWTDSVGNVGRYYGGKTVPECKAFYVRTYKMKIYGVAGTTLYYSGVADPMEWNDVNAGAGETDLSREDSDMTDCVALEAYYDKLAIFSKTACQLWVVDPDPLKNFHVQTLRDAGTIAWRSVLQYGSGDVLYLSPSGVRSLRARNSSLAAAVSDVGSPLDPILQELFESQGEDWISGTVSMLQPVTGRFWVILPDRIFVLSAFPGPKITAWSQYDPASGTSPRFKIVAAVTHKHKVVVRDEANHVWVYGGTGPPVYDNVPVELVFPFHGGDAPATAKTFQAIDAAAAGKWELSFGVNVNDEDVEEYALTIDGPTYAQGKQQIYCRGTHISLRLRAFEEGPAVLSNLTVHYRPGEAG